MRGGRTGERIRSLRTSRGMTLEQFGELFDPPASKSIVSRWEAGKSIPSNERLKNLSDKFKISTNYLLYGKDEKEKQLEFYKEKEKFLLDRTFDLLLLMSTKQQAEILQEMRKCLEKESE